MTARKPKKPVPHINELPPMGADFYYDLLPKLGKQDEQMREAMEILRHPWAKLVLDPEVDRHQAQIALANLIKKAYYLGHEAAQQLANLRKNAAKAGDAAAKTTPEERAQYIREAEALRISDQKYESDSLVATVLMDRYKLHDKISHRQMRRIVGGK
jgi:hypothetical protein